MLKMEVQVAEMRKRRMSNESSLIRQSQLPFPRSIGKRKTVSCVFDTYRKANPSDRVIELDLYQEDLPYYNDVMLDGMAKRRTGAELSSAEKEAAGRVMSFLDPFITADKIVFAFPMWNFTVPAVLHTYIDYVSQPGIAYRELDEA